MKVKEGVDFISITPLTLIDDGCLQSFKKINIRERVLEGHHGFALNIRPLTVSIKASIDDIVSTVTLYDYTVIRIGVYRVIALSIRVIMSKDHQVEDTVSVGKSGNFMCRFVRVIVGWSVIDINCIVSGW